MAWIRKRWTYYLLRLNLRCRIRRVHTEKNIQNSHNYYREGARAALSLGGTLLGYYLVRILPSMIAILLVNPTFRPWVMTMIVLEYLCICHVFFSHFLFSCMAYFELHYRMTYYELHCIFNRLYLLVS